MKLNDKKDGDNGYIVLYNGITYEVYAKNVLDARQVAVKYLRVKPNKQYLVSVYKAENADGSIYIQPTT